MFKRTNFQIILIVFLFNIILGSIYVIKADVCPNPIVNADDFYWHYMKDKVWSLYEHRDWLMYYFDLSESDWDGGWGVHKLDDPDPHKYALPKMMNAMDYIISALDDRVKLQSDWERRSFFSGEGTHSVLSRSSESIEMFGRGSDGSLVYTVMWADSQEWIPGSISPSRRTYVLYLRTDKGIRFIHGNPCVINRGMNNLDLFFRSGRDLVHAKWSSSITNAVKFPTVPSDWSLECPTELTTRPVVLMGQSRYFISTDPVVITRGNDNIDIFAIDELSGHLIHYYWTPISGWGAEDINEIAGGNRKFQGDPVIINRGGLDLDILIPDDRGHLIHYQWSAENTRWKREDATQNVGENLSIESQPVVISRSYETMDVFARGQIADLIHYNWSSENGWSAENITDNINAEPIDGRPAALTRSDNTIDAYARGYTWRSLIQFHWTSSNGWTTKDITAGMTFPTRYQIDGDPIAVGDENRVDVLARRLGGHLIHYYWTPEVAWVSENVNYSPNVSPVYDILVDDPINIVPRTENVLDVIGKWQFGSIYFTSAIGLSLNGNPWHSNSEYFKFAAGRNHQFEYEPDNSDEYGAFASWGVFQDDYVGMCCHSFDSNCYPALRAAWMIHEATHMNYHQNHDELNGEDADKWIWHGLHEPQGALTGGVPAEGSNYVLVPTHKPYQLSVESLCDYFEMSRDGIPIEAYNNAKNDANYYQDNHIINPPGWRCGIPRPLY